MLMAAKKEQSFHWSREARRVQVLNDGRNLRVFDHEGFAWTLGDTDVDCAEKLQAFLADVRDHDSDCAERILDELPEVWRERADRNLTKADEDEVIR
jgi:hypothetical protein